MLMRYSGLAIRDAATLRRDAIQGGLLTLRRAKTNELVLCALPDPVLVELNAIADPFERPLLLDRQVAAGHGGSVLEIPASACCAAGRSEGL